MKIDTNTMTVLKNFAKINPSIMINEGNTLKTVSSTKTIVGKANVSTLFEQKFAIYNLDRFLSTLGLFKDPELTFQEKYVTISGDNKKLNYTYADESIIVKAPEKDIVLPSEDVTIKITNDEMKDVEKALSILGLPEIVISGDGNKVYLQAVDTKNPSGDIYSIEIDDTDKTFKAIFKSENIKILPGDYEVIICSKGISFWKNEIVEYFIAVESTSTF
jgi:hypothetical protein